MLDTSKLPKYGVKKSKIMTLFWCFVRPEKFHPYGWIFSRWIFFPKVVTFFSTSSAVFYHFWHWFTCFDRYFLSIMSAGVAKTNSWTCHLMKTTWKPPLNTGDFEVFTHFYSFCTSLLCFQIKLNPSRTLVFYVYHVWKLFSSFVSLSFYHL